MHIHGNSMDVQAANFYPAGLQNRAAAERAAEVRKRLLKKSQSLEADGSPDSDADAELLIGRWMDGRYSQAQSDDEYKV